MYLWLLYVAKVYKVREICFIIGRKILYTICVTIGSPNHSSLSDAGKYGKAIPAKVKWRLFGCLNRIQLLQIELYLHSLQRYSTHQTQVILLISHIGSCNHQPPEDDNLFPRLFEWIRSVYLLVLLVRCVAVAPDLSYLHHLWATTVW